ncbi:MAG: DUF4296 domain-containing protein [Bacteroidales bacterium]|nr:DUF4296 domain-containing protein [Bacteroidales bacterium]MDE5956434.1 DUF4296 domain-containing protein [Bacteroidales bacterium]MDE6147180.1 DUF4296 domain-containing protein [Bacteroidales bacterium]
MKRISWHIVFVCVAFAALLVSCGKDRAKVIPRSTLAKIYAEMLLTDQWIASAPSIKRIADTSLVYEPILEKYGYNSEDYRKSVEHYLDDPERFSRIFRSASEILDAHIKELKALQKIREENTEKHDFCISVGHVVPDIGNIPPSYTPDSLVFELDTALMYYRLNYVERYDTVYRGPEFIVRIDTVSVCDSICAVDSLPALLQEPEAVSEPGTASVANERSSDVRPLVAGRGTAVLKMSADTLASKMELISD